MVIVKPPCHIPSEIFLALPARMAWQYRIIPYGVEHGILYCLGEEGQPYEEAIPELEARYGNKIRLELIPARQLEKLLIQYYRISRDTRLP